MPPFLISLVSRGNIWAFISSAGSLCAGRESETEVIFPYVTDDKIHDAYGSTGPQTLIELESGQLWEPFSPQITREQRGKRILTKHALSDCLTFTEVSPDKNLRFSYTWQSAESYGLVRRVHLENLGSNPQRLKILDGVLNIMPPGIDARLQSERSTLVDGYKQSELLENSRIAVYSTASGITDRPYPLENLYANMAGSFGLPDAQVSLAHDAAERMKNGQKISVSNRSQGQRGAYWLTGDLLLEVGETQEWFIFLDCNLDASEVTRRQSELESEPVEGAQRLEADLEKNRAELNTLLASADALQCSHHQLTEMHHRANVLFNSMRGGVFIKNYSIEGSDFQAHVKEANRALFEHYLKPLQELKGWLDYATCREKIEALNDEDLLRLFLEYLPITFSRRHGDPSRPWNKFMIRTHDDKGNQIIAYQGNWRDIFQNWEALCMSYPNFLEHVVVKFLNTSTMDGYNPYRIFNGGFDWEEIEADDPFSGIGYWGDHQIVYLLRLLEAMSAHNPAIMDQWLEKAVFVFAYVPYRIKSYADILKDTRSTIDFDSGLSEKLRFRHENEGSDGLLLRTSNDSILKANLLEKLLIPALVKLGNFVPGGGIWMNTERPEWNDANNALVGNGLSMVTAGHLLRYLSFCRHWWARIGKDRSVFLNSSVVDFSKDLLEAFDLHSCEKLSFTIDSKKRASIMKTLGLAGQNYRERIYTGSNDSTSKLEMSALLRLLEASEEWLKITLVNAKRDEGLMESYNLLSFSDPNQEIQIKKLYEMLEGQVSAISARFLSDTEIIKLVEALFKSALYTEDRDSFLLYPDRKLQDFLDKGLISAEAVNRSNLLQALIKAGDTRIVVVDKHKRVRFAPSLVNTEALDGVLKSIACEKQFSNFINKENDLVHSIYEMVFNHHTFTGRSGGMFSYEGLGCIYWHQVSKLLLAVQECFLQESESAKPDLTMLQSLGDCYYKIRKGIGFNKTAQAFGAFPTDPYSHTPAHAGAQQPGMTGQAKEEILTRFGELGIRIRGGTLHINPQLLLRDEFLKEGRIFSVVHIDESTENIEMAAGELGFTFCQVPFVYRLESQAATLGIEITYRSGEKECIPSATLPAEPYGFLSSRDGRIYRITVSIPSSLLIF